MENCASQPAPSRRHGTAFRLIMAAVLATAGAGALALILLAGSPQAGPPQTAQGLGPRLPLLLIASGMLGMAFLVMLLRTLNRAMLRRLRPLADAGAPAAGLRPGPRLHESRDA